MSISRNIQSIRATLPEGVDLLCVSKYHSVEAIREAYAAGERLFGESRVQELLQKQETLPKDIHWHFIGHLQTNKIRMILPFVDLIHGVDSWRLLEAINKEAAKLQLDHPVRVLLEVKVAQEATKYGFAVNEILEMFKPNKDNYPLSISNYPFIQICGIMGMASNTDNQEQIAAEFAALNTIYHQVSPLLKSHYHTDHTILSMGMSEDYPLAIAHGSTLIRIGSGIFGERE